MVLTRAELVVPVPGLVPSSAAAAAPLMLTTALLLLEDAAGAGRCRAAFPGRGYVSR